MKLLKLQQTSKKFPHLKKTASIVNVCKKKVVKTIKANFQLPTFLTKPLVISTFPVKL